MADEKEAGKCPIQSRKGESVKCAQENCEWWIDAKKYNWIDNQVSGCSEKLKALALFQIEVMLAAMT